MAIKDMATRNRESANAAGPTLRHPTHTHIVPNPKVSIDPMWQHYPQDNIAEPVTLQTSNRRSPTEQSARLGDLIYLILSH